MTTLVILRSLALIPWLALSLIGGAFLLTGRRLPGGLPTWIGDGWRLRGYGLVICIAGVYFVRLALSGPIYWVAVIGSFAGLTYFAWRLLRASGKPAT